MSKRVVDASNNNQDETPFYIRDAFGKLMATYKHSNSELRFKEAPIYGSNRLGVRRFNYLMNPSTNPSPGPIVIGVIPYNIGAVGIPVGEIKKLFNPVGLKEYEITNHLGNVLATVSDKVYEWTQIIPHPYIGGGQTLKVIHRKAFSLTQQDYYPGGMLMPGRHGALDNTGSFVVEGDGTYRHGYQGSEKDNEIYGNGNMYTTELRGLDTRTLRWWSIDPKASLFPDKSPYMSMDGNPILLNDPKGDCPTCPVGAAVGFLADLTVQVGTSIISQQMKGGDWTWSQVAKDYSITRAAVATGAGFVTSGLSAYASTAEVAVAGASFSMAGQMAEGKTINPVTTAIEAMPVPATKLTVMNPAKYEKAVVQAENSIAKSNSPVRQAKLNSLENAQNKLSNVNGVNNAVNGFNSSVMQNGASSLYESATTKNSGSGSKQGTISPVTPQFNINSYTQDNYKKSSVSESTKP